MRITTLSVMKNEADIIEVFIRYHLQFVSRMVIVDHASTDSSAKIVKQLIGAGLPVELHTSIVVGHHQNAILNEHAQMFLAVNSADWIIPLDIDEFIVARKPLEIILQTASTDAPLELLWKTYVPTADDDQSEKNVLKRIKHCMVTEAGIFSKIAIPAQLLRAGYRIAMGNHALMDKHGTKCIKIQSNDQLFLAHFPVRSPEQFMGKVLAGWLATAAKAEKAKNEAFHWKKNFDRFLAEGMPAYVNLQPIALDMLNQEQKNICTELHVKPVDYSIPASEHLSSLTYEANPVTSALMTAEAIALELSALRADALKINKHTLANALILKMKRKLRSIVDV